MKSVFFCFLVLAVLVVLSAASHLSVGPSNYFSASDATHLQQQVLSKQTADGHFGSLKETHNAVQTLLRLKVEVPKKKEICSWVRTQNQEDMDINTAYQSANIVHSLHCGESGRSVIPDTVVQRVVSLDDSQSLLTTYFSVSISAATGVRMHNVPAIVKKLVSLYDEGGAFRSPGNQGKGTSFNTALVLSSLATLAKDKQLGPEDRDQISKIVDHLSSVYSSLTEDSKPLSETDSVKSWFSYKNVPSLQITSIILEATADLYSILQDKKVKIPAEKIAQIGEYLLTYKTATQLDELYYFVLGFNSLVDSRLPHPVVLTVSQGVFKASAKNEPLQVTVTDLKGNAVTSDVTLVKAVSLSDAKNLVSRKETLASSGSAYELDFTKHNPSPGAYQLDFSVQPKDQNYIGFKSASRVVKVLTRATLSNLKLIVGEAGDEKSKKRLEVTYPNKLSEQISLSGAQRLALGLEILGENGKPLHVQQVSVGFTNIETNHEVVLEAHDDTTLGSYRLTLALDKAEQAHLFYSQSGTYNVRVLVGDSIIENPMNWNLGHVSLEFRGGSSAVNLPNEITLNTDLPVMHHTFRPADKRAPHIVSLTFTILVLSPLALLFVGLAYYRANINNFPTGAGFIDAIGFQLSLLAILGLFALFWIELTMITALKFLALLALPTVLFGQRNLRRIATAKRGSTS